MDDLNMFHVLADNVRDIGHGIEVVKQDAIDSKTLVCYLDKEGGFHFGFCYKNGSNLRVVCWENQAIRFRTSYKGSYVIAFTGRVLTQHNIKGDFTADDFNFDWFGQEQQDAVKEELLALIRKKDAISNVVDLLSQLTIDEINNAKDHIQQLKHPDIN